MLGNDDSCCSRTVDMVCMWPMLVSVGQKMVTVDHLRLIHCGMRLIMAGALVDARLDS